MYYSVATLRKASKAVRQKVGNMPVQIDVSVQFINREILNRVSQDSHYGKQFMGFRSVEEDVGA